MCLKRHVVKKSISLPSRKARRVSKNIWQPRQFQNLAVRPNQEMISKLKANSARPWANSKMSLFSPKFLAARFLSRNHFGCSLRKKSCCSLLKIQSVLILAASLFFSGSFLFRSRVATSFQILSGLTGLSRVMEHLDFWASFSPASITQPFFFSQCSTHLFILSSGVGRSLMRFCPKLQRYFLFFQK